MHTLVKYAIRWYQISRDAVRADERYRYYSVYAAALVSFFLTMFLWPFDLDIWHTAHAYCPWVFPLWHTLFEVGLVLAVCLAAVGFLRRPLASKLLAVAAAYKGIEMLFAWDMIWLPSNYVRTLLLDIPYTWIERWSGGNPGTRTMLWFIYLCAAWIAVRPLARRVWRGIVQMKHMALQRYPHLKALDTQVF